MSVFRGARVDGAEYFDDITGQNEDAGVFAGLGSDDYENTKETVGNEGLKVQMNCRVCNQRHEIVLEWQELFIVGSNGPGRSLLKPTGWEYSENNAKLYPANVPCKKCNAPICPQVSPDEARQLVNDAVSRNLVSSEAAAHWNQQVQSVRASRGG